MSALATHDAHAAEPLNAGGDRVGDRAIVVGDALFAAVAHVHQIRQQCAAAGGGAAHTCETLDARVPKQDGGLAIDEHDAVVHVVDEFLFEHGRRRVGGRV